MLEGKESIMNVTYTIRASKNDESFVPLKQVTKLLEEVLGQSSESARAEWDMAKGERGNPVYVLGLSDGIGGEARTEFTPGELRDVTELRRRLRWLWGDVLQDRSHRQLEALVSAEGAEGD